MMTNNTNKRIHKNGSTVAIRRVSFLLFLQILQTTLQLPTVLLVESLSIQSQTSWVSSPFLTHKSSPLLSVTRCISSTTCPSDRISRSRTTSSISRSTFFPPLYTTSDDTLGSSSSTNNTTKELDSDNATHANKETASDSNAEATSDGDGGLLPSYKQLIVFTATTILIWLSEPLLSLVDTTIVGLTASTKSAVVQIAALGPATTLFDSLIYTTYFLAISTTNQLAPRLAAANSLSDKNKNKSKNNNTINPWKELRQSTSHLLGLAVVFGSIVTAITFAFGRPIIGKMVGGATSMGAAEANAIVPMANNYARIRAAVAPFSILGFVAQSVSKRMFVITFCFNCLILRLYRRTFFSRLSMNIFYASWYAL